MLVSSYLAKICVPCVIFSCQATFILALHSLANLPDPRCTKCTNSCEQYVPLGVRLGEVELGEIQYHGSHLRLRRTEHRVLVLHHDVQGARRSFRQTHRPVKPEVNTRTTSINETTFAQRGEYRARDDMEQITAQRPGAARFQNSLSRPFSGLITNIGQRVTSSVGESLCLKERRTVVTLTFHQRSGSDRSWWSASCACSTCCPAAGRSSRTGQTCCRRHSPPGCCETSTIDSHSKEI